MHSPSVAPPAVTPSVIVGSAIALIEERASTNRFDPTRGVTEAEITDLIRLATRAPTAYNLQNWRFIAVRSAERKAVLRALAYDQAKVTEAAVTIIVCGQRPDADRLPDRLRTFVDSGHMPVAMADAWTRSARAQYADPQTARDEAVRSASLGAATLMHAAAALGLASGPMVGFDAAGVARAFDLTEDEVPVMLLAVGHAAPGNWPQKPRRPVTELLTIA